MIYECMMTFLRFLFYEYGVLNEHCRLSKYWTMDKRRVEPPLVQKKNKMRNIIYGITDYDGS
jgi:hypothetical protein